MDSVTMWTAVGAVGTTIGTLGTFGAAAVAFLSFRSQLRDIKVQSELTARAARSQLYGLVSQAMYQIHQTLDANPSWRQYLYGNVPPPPDADLRARLDNFCESFVDFVDDVVEQKRSLPENMDWSTWEAYFRFVYANSPVLRAFVYDNFDFYPDYVFAALGIVVVREPGSGRLSAVWEVREFEEETHAALRGLLAPAEQPLIGLRGYPWVRTWVFTRTQPDGAPAPSLLAVVAASDGRLARVLTRSTTPPSEREADVLRSWIIGTMEGTGIERVEVSLPQGGSLWYDPNQLGLRGALNFGINEYRPVRPR